MKHNPHSSPGSPGISRRVAKKLKPGAARAFAVVMALATTLGLVGGFAPAASAATPVPPTSGTVSIHQSRLFKYPDSRTDDGRQMGTQIAFGTIGDISGGITGPGVSSGVIYCIDPYRASPPDGDYQYSPMTNELARKALWYGPNGLWGFESPRYWDNRDALYAGIEAPQNWKELNEDGLDPQLFHYAVTHMLVSNVVGGHPLDNHGTASQPNVVNDHGALYGISDDQEAMFRGWIETLKSRLEAMPAPPSDFVTYFIDAPKPHIQRVIGSFYIPTRKLSIHKSVAGDQAVQDYVSGNPAYDMSGIEYGIYRDEAATQEITRVTLDSAGNSPVIETSEQGPFYAKEISSGKGFFKNDQVYRLDVNAGGTGTFEVADEPMKDPMAVLIGKVIDGPDKTGVLEGNLTSLAGVKFRVDYYKGLYNNAADAQASGQPQASAVFETDKDGFLQFANAKPVDGTNWPYKEANGWNTIPLGTVVLTETYAPKGIAVNRPASAPQAFQIVDSGDHQTPRNQPVGDNWPNIAVSNDAVGAKVDDTYSGGVSLVKVDADSKSSTENPQGNGWLEGVTYSIINRSAHSVYRADKSEVKVGEEFMRITTKKDEATGKVIASTGNHDLPYGTYEVTEVAGNDGYRNGGFKETVTIEEDGKIVPLGKQSANPIKRGGVKVIKADTERNDSKPQGDATLEGASFDIINQSSARVFVEGKWYNPGQVVKRITTEKRQENGKTVYVAETGDQTLPYGAYELKEVVAPEGYHLADWQKSIIVSDEKQVIQITNNQQDWPRDQVWRGGVEVVKADADTKRSEPQGDADLAGVQYNIINRSAESVIVDGKVINPGQVAKTITTVKDGDRYIARTGDKDLPYGTYDIVEVKVSEGYLLPNPPFTKQFTIRRDNQRESYVDKMVAKPDRQWNENRVQRGGIIVGKVDRETNSYTALGGATLAGATFDVINRSQRSVVVDGKEFKPGQVVKTITSQKMSWKGADIIAAYTGDHSLPYGTYEVRETASSKGYLYDKQSKAYTKTVQVRADGEVKELVKADDGDTQAVANQVSREDFNFKKKAEDTMDRMGRVPFLVTSMTTGEKHVIVTDENGTYHSSAHDDVSGALHTSKTNANDPTSPVSNGAVAIDADGNWYVKDASKLDPDAGLWFTGLRPENTMWAADGKSYTEKGKSHKISVNDALRAMPYDDYIIQEMRAPSNEGYNLVTAKLTLKEYTRDHDGEGLDVDYGTIDDRPVAVESELTYADDEKVVPAAKDTPLVDTLTYEGLTPGASYTAKGELHKIDADGKDLGVVATAEQKFNAGKLTIGRTAVNFVVDTSALQGAKLVAFQGIYDESGQEVASHRDPEAESQTVTVPEIHTTLTGEVDHENTAQTSHVELTDVVEYHGLQFGKSYTVSGVLMDKSTGKPVLDKNGAEVRASKTVVATQSDGSVEMVFSFDVEPGALAGKSTVAFESVLRNDVTYATHADINDEGQTVHFPDLGTTATDKVDGNHEVAAAEKQTIVDTVKATNLQVGKKYTVSGVLHLKNSDGTDGGVLKDKDGKEVRASKEFTADKADMDVALEFVVDTSALRGRDVVAFEDLSRDKISVGTHADITDDSQTVHIPDVGTTLVTADGLPVAQVDEHGESEVKLVDTVRYSNVEKGAKYSVKGVLHLRDADGKDAGVLKDADGNDVTASAEFTAEDRSGSVDVTFTFKADAELAKKLNGASTVAFETLSRDGIDLVSHADISDEGQTVHFVDLGTTATDASTGTHTGTNEAVVTVVDAVKYSNLIPGKEYTVDGALHVRGDDGSDAGVLKDKDGNDVTSSVTFVAEKSEGTVDMTFTFAPGADWAGTTVVAFEDLSHAGKKFASHADISDEDQTVHIPSVGTTAKDQGTDGPMVAHGDTATIIDTVTYKNVVPGSTYQVVGTLHVAAHDGDQTVDAGELKDSDGNVVTVTSESFKAETAEGTVDVEFTVDVAALKAAGVDLDGRSLVVFEDLQEVVGDKPVTVGHHRDITDKGQTVHFADVHTTASDGPSGTHTGSLPEGERTTVTVNDAVAYTNLVPGREYTVDGVLHVQKLVTRAEAVAMYEAALKSGDEAAATSARVAADSTGVKPSEAAKPGVIFVPSAADAAAGVAAHTVEAALTDADAESATPTTMSAVDDDMVVVDGGVLTDADGKEVIASVTFTPETANGTVNLEFTFTPGPEFAGTTVVAFEDLKDNGILIGTHADIHDEQQAVHFPKIATRAKDDLTRENMLNALTADGGSFTLTDTVSYENLLVGQSYTVSGTVHLRDADGKDLGAVKDAEGDEITGQTVFTPQAQTGTVDVQFTVPMSAVKDGQSLVVFEKLAVPTVVTDMPKTDEPAGEKPQENPTTVVATHEDITDEGQSVHKGWIGTTLTGNDGEAKEVGPDTMTELIDTVEYHNLAVGREYELTGQLFLPDGTEYRDGNNAPVTGTATFVAEQADGTAEIHFQLDTSALPDGAQLVAFETLTVKPDLPEGETPEGPRVPVAVHHDPKDEAQTVTVRHEAPPSRTPVTLKTGVDSWAAWIAAGMLLLTAAVAGYVFYRVRKRSEDTDAAE